MKLVTSVDSRVQLKPDQFGFYHLIIKITNRYNGKVYICKHSTTNPYDSYMGSSSYLKQDIRSYGKKVFNKEIIECVQNAEILELYERSIVDDDFLKNNYTYNKNVGGAGRKMVMTRREYFAIKEREERKLRRKEQQRNQVKHFIQHNIDKGKEVKPNIELKFYKFEHCCIEFCRDFIMKIISAGISFVYFCRNIVL